jgi:hypothetical protein
MERNGEGGTLPRCRWPARLLPQGGGACEPPVSLTSSNASQAPCVHPLRRDPHVARASLGCPADLWGIRRQGEDAPRSDPSWVRGGVWGAWWPGAVVTAVEVSPRVGGRPPPLRLPFRQTRRQNVP